MIPILAASTYPVSSEHFLARDDVAQVGFAVLLVVHCEEGLAVAGTASVVDVEHHVTVVDQRLRECEIADLRLSARSAMNKYNCRRLRGG